MTYEYIYFADAAKAKDEWTVGQSSAATLNHQTCGYTDGCFEDRKKVCIESLPISFCFESILTLFLV